MAGSEPAEVGHERPLVVAFYLPQFHPIPENDAWWGRGFTEWTNVVTARPLFDGHEQPDLPGDLGFYDLRVPEVREQQAALARAHGIDAFCYYHYWFGGRRVLDRVFDEVRSTGRPDLPFCLCWANEPWNRAWDGGSDEALLTQHYDADERRAHIEWLVDAFGDERYLRHEGRPLFSIYRVQELEDASGFVAALRAACAAAGVADPYVVKFDTHSDFQDPAESGCDAASQFFPHGAIELGLADRQLPLGEPGDRVFDYEVAAEIMSSQPVPAWTRHECVVPGWDNTARRGPGRSFVLHGATPERYERWLGAVAGRAHERGGLLFVNAWNEWAEGAHLEPSQRWGDGFLRATARVILGAEPTPAAARDWRPEDVPPPAPVEALYDELYQRYIALQERQSLLEATLTREVERARAPVLEELEAQRALVAELTAALERLRPGS